MAKRAIFLQNILWESCSKFNSKQYSNSIFGQNIDSLAVARENILPWKPITLGTKAFFVLSRSQILSLSNEIKIPRIYPPV